MARKTEVGVGRSEGQRVGRGLDDRHAAGLGYPGANKKGSASPTAKLIDARMSGGAQESPMAITNRQCGTNVHEIASCVSLPIDKRADQSLGGV